MDTKALERFAQTARRQLLDEVGAKLEQVLATDSAELREKADAIQELRRQIKESSKQAVIDRVAYTWFNRFCALRFMDANHYTRSGVVSPLPGHTQPEILQDAKQGHIADDLKHTLDIDRVFALLSGELRSSDPQGEAYRLLLVGVCNSYHKQMPFLFEKINDYTELLMPDDLLSEASILQAMREAMSEETCKDVEVIGWLYQYYISERKDEVYGAIKKGKKIRAADIPAATQLFTPHWIVRYLIENSLGRLWMLNNADSKLSDRMEYYIDDRDLPDGENQVLDFARVSSPEEIKVCDPACGSGHMLTYAFDLLHAMYEEQGYDPREIPSLILTKNLTGIEIDERAGALAAFALVMKGREKDPRFFNRGVQPGICVLEDISFTEDELTGYMDRVGRNLFTAPLQETLEQFKDAKHFGSLIRPIAGDVSEILRVLKGRNVGGDIFLNETHQRVLKALLQADVLSDKHHVVVANPPYLGKGMNTVLKDFAKKHYSDTKSDLFAMFIQRNTELAVPGGQLGYMSPFVWMFISSYEKLRTLITSKKTITSLIQLEYSGFEGATVPICTFTLENAPRPNFNGGYVRLSEFRGAEDQAPKTREAVSNRDCGWFYRASATDFKKIPGSPIAYWVSDAVRHAFEEFPTLSPVCKPTQGLATGDNARFVRAWHEVERSRTGFGMGSRQDAQSSGKRWFPYNKGGDFRKWYGNQEYVVDWENDGAEIRTFGTEHGGRPRSRAQNTATYFRKAASWSKISSGYPAFRFFPNGFIYDVAGTSIFSSDDELLLRTLGYCNSSVVRKYLEILSPTLNFEVGHIKSLPLHQRAGDVEDIRALVARARTDWDSYEIAWDFRSTPLVMANSELRPSLEISYQTWIARNRETIAEMKRLEEENNCLFIAAYGLQDELTSVVPIEQITLTVNPAYRYGKHLEDNEWSVDEGFGEELEARFLKDTMDEFISYAVGCMLGRYSLDKPGLILANQGDTVAEYMEQIPEPTFMPDEDNVIPILDGDWFTDDIVDRFCQFLRTTFGDEHYQENLTFLENAIGKPLRKYFLKDFYKSHVQRYKKRPIYWLFSSPKGSFNALIYMHRYTPDTVSIVLNDYLREFRAKLVSRREHLEQISVSISAPSRDKTAALKEIEKLKSMLEELDQYESEILYPLATQRIEIDLDDGVKVNYNKFGRALQKVTGLSKE